MLKDEGVIFRCGCRRDVVLGCVDDLIEKLCTFYQRGIPG